MKYWWNSENLVKLGTGHPPSGAPFCGRVTMEPLVLLVFSPLFWSHVWSNSESNPCDEANCGQVVFFHWNNSHLGRCRLLGPRFTICRFFDSQNGHFYTPKRKIRWNWGKKMPNRARPWGRGRSEFCKKFPCFCHFFSPFSFLFRYLSYLFATLVAPCRAILRYYRCDTPYREILF